MDDILHLGNYIASDFIDFSKNLGVVAFTLCFCVGCSVLLFKLLRR